MTNAFETRLYVETALTEAAEIFLDADRTHYLRNVLRLRPGLRVQLFNGRDGEWVAEIHSLDKRTASLTVATRARMQTREPDLWLAFAPIKRARIDFVAQKATEMGASRLWPVFTRFTQMGRVNLARMRANAIEAAEQCGRLSVPDVRDSTDLDSFVTDWPNDRVLFVCDETGCGTPILRALSGLDSRKAGFLIGPEGGLAKAELDRLGKLPNVCRVSLGPRILRADTAALAAVACWQAAVGDWKGGPKDEM